MTVPASASPGDVFARERQEHIVRIVEEHGRVRVGDLATRFQVSAVTIRKDLLGLEANHRLIRTHGGAIAIDRSRPELAFDIRERLQSDEKLAIGVAAAALVHDGESIVMDASTTALSVARQLTDADASMLLDDADDVLLAFAGEDVARGGAGWNGQASPPCRLGTNWGFVWLHRHSKRHVNAMSR